MMQATIRVCFLWLCFALRRAVSYHVVDMRVPSLVKGVDGKREISKTARHVEAELNIYETDNIGRFKDYDWDGHSDWDWLAVWKHDPSSPERACKQNPGHGWLCKRKYSFTSGKDYVKRDGVSFVSLTFTKPLTPTIEDGSVYYVYYCLTPWSFRAFSYDCIARTPFVMPDYEARDRLDARLAKPVNDRVSVSPKDATIPKTGSFSVTVKRERASFGMSSDDFVAVWKVRGKDIGCREIIEDGGTVVFECHKNEILTEMEGNVYNSPVITSSRDYALTWSHTPTSDARAGYAVLYCKTPVLGGIFMGWRTHYRCEGRSALFVPDLAANGPRVSADTAIRTFTQQDLDTMFACKASPGLKDIKRSLRRLRQRGVVDETSTTSDGDATSASGNDDLEAAELTKALHFQNFETVVDLGGFVIGYDAMRVNDLQGQASLQFEGDRLKFDVFRDGDAETNLLRDTDCKPGTGRTSHARIMVDFVNFKVMRSTDPDDVYSAAAANFEIDFAVSLEAFYREPGETPTVHALKKGDRVMVKGDAIFPELLDISDYEARVVERDASKLIVEFSNHMRLPIPFDWIVPLPPRSWYVRSSDVRVCVLNVDFDIDDPEFDSIATETGAKVADALGGTRLARWFASGYVEKTMLCKVADGVGGNALAALAGASRDAEETERKLFKCSQTNDPTPCGARTIEDVRARLETISANKHSVHARMNIALQNKESDDQHISFVLRTGLDTSSRSLITRLTAPYLYTAEHANDGDNDALLSLQTSSRSSPRHRQRHRQQHHAAVGDDNVSPLAQLVSMLNDDAHRMSAEVARANPHAATLLRSIGNMMVAGTTNLNLIFEGGVEINPPVRSQDAEEILMRPGELPVSLTHGAEHIGSLCTTHEHCEARARVRADRAVSALRVPSSYPVHVPLMWIDPQTSVGSFAVADLDSEETFELFGDIGFDVSGGLFEGPLRRLVQTAMSEPRDDRRLARKLATYRRAADVLISSGAGAILKTTDGGLRIDKENLRLHGALMVMGPKDLGHFIKWSLEELGELQDLAQQWARERIAELRQKSLQEAEDLRFSKATTEANPCERRVPRPLGIFDDCRQCVDQNVNQNGTKRTWERVFFLPNVDYTGCYWDRSRRECRMISEDEDPPPKPLGRRSATSLSECVQLFEAIDGGSRAHDRSKAKPAPYDYEGYASLLRDTRGVAALYYSNSSSTTPVGDECVRYVISKVGVKDLGIKNVLSRMACVRAAAAHTMSKHKDIKAAHRKSKLFPSGEMRKPLKLGPHWLRTENDDDVVERLQNDWANDMVEGFQPRCGSDAANETSSDPKEKTSASKSEKTSANNEFDDKTWFEDDPFDISTSKYTVIPLGKKIAMGIGTVSLDGIDMAVHAETHNGQLRVWLQAKRSTSTTFEKYAALVDMCDPNIPATASDLASARVVTRDIKMAYRYAKRKGIVYDIPAMAAAVRIGAYASLDWDSESGQWRVASENTRFCLPLPDRSDETMFQAVGRHVKNFFTGRRTRNKWFDVEVALGDERGDETLLDGIVKRLLPFIQLFAGKIAPAARAASFCAIHQFTVEDSSSVVGAVLGALVDEENRDPVAEAHLLEHVDRRMHEDRGLSFSVQIHLADRGQKTERLHASTLFRTLMHTEPLASIIGESRGVDASSSSSLEALLRHSKTSMTNSSDVLEGLIDTIANLFASKGSDLAFASDLYLGLDMHSEELNRDTLTIESMQSQLTGTAHDVPIPVHSFFSAPIEFAVEAAGLSEKAVKRDALMFSLDSIEAGASPVHVSGPALGSITTLSRSVCSKLLSHNESTNVERSQRMDVACEMLSLAVEYLRNNDVKAFARAGKKDVPGSGIFFNKEILGSSFQISFDGPTNVKAFAEYFFEKYLRLSDYNEETAKKEKDEGNTLSSVVRSLGNGLKGIASSIKGWFSRR